ncbi:hypothetical protein PG997_012046 [Apiospora hydei]|uniref:Uncharacterized protein n=1 Tax=Apiospora hydei TaxID=1337664 RepID=A0ABR1V5H3_9PEZI
MSTQYGGPEFFGQVSGFLFRFPILRIRMFLLLFLVRVLVLVVTGLLPPSPAAKFCANLEQPLWPPGPA